MLNHGFFSRNMMLPGDAVYAIRKNTHYRSVLMQLHIATAPSASKACLDPMARLPPLLRPDYAPLLLPLIVRAARYRSCGSSAQRSTARPATAR